MVEDELSGRMQRTEYITKLECTWANAKRDGCPAEHRWALCSTPQSLADAHYLTAVQ